MISYSVSLGIDISTCLVSLANVNHFGGQINDLHFVFVFVVISGLSLVVEIILHVWFLLYICVFLCYILLHYKGEFDKTVFNLS